MMPKIKIGIVGTGRMGSLHLSKFQEMPEVELVGVFEPHLDRAKEIEAKNKVKAISSLSELIFLADALIIASPTPTHFSIAKMAMEFGCHVLIEKPFCETHEEAILLEHLALKNRLVCQVGFLERFRLEALLGGNPLPIDSTLDSLRLSTVVGREVAVDVISDLMIHDIDLILSLIQEDPIAVQAEGFSIVTDYLDFVKARLEFSSGRSATLTASRVASKLVRTLQAVSGNYFCELDFVSNSKFIASKSGNHNSSIHGLAFDALQAQSSHFIAAIQGRAFSKVTAKDSVRVISVVNKIKEATTGSPVLFSPHKSLQSSRTVREN